MAMSVPSRFACLKIEDDDYRPHNPNKEKNGNKKKQANNKSESKKQAKGNGNAKNNQVITITILQLLCYINAFHIFSKKLISNQRRKRLIKVLNSGNNGNRKIMFWLKSAMRMTYNRLFIQLTLGLWAFLIKLPGGSEYILT